MLCVLLLDTHVQVHTQWSSLEVVTLPLIVFKAVYCHRIDSGGTIDSMPRKQPRIWDTVKFAAVVEPRSTAHARMYALS